MSQQLQGGHVAGGVHWTGEENERQETDCDYEDSLDPWTSEWYDIEGHDDESYSEEPDWTENFYETDEYDANDSTFSEHIPALLDQPVETQEGDASKLETVQEAVAAANAAADMSRRTWTQARQPMKDVQPIAWIFSSLQRQSNGGGSWHRQVTRQEGTPPAKENTAERAKEKARGGVQAHVFCVRDLIGLVTVLHIMVEKASASPQLARDPGTLHRFDKLIWKATNMIGSQVQVPSQSRCHLLQNFASFDLDGKCILNSGATMSMRRR